MNWKTNRRWSALGLIALLAAALAGLAWLSATIPLSGTALAAPPGPAGQIPQTEWILQGRVYEGTVGDESTPIQGVTVSVYGANNPYPDPGVYIRSATTNAQGWYGITIYDDDGAWEFYHIRESDPPGYVSVGATSVSGNVRDANWIEYLAPLTGQTLTGNKFWDEREVEPTTTPTPTPTATPTQVLDDVDLEISKTFSLPEPVPAGSYGHYRLRIENHGPSVAYNVVITDVLPAEFAFDYGATTCSQVASRPPNDIVRCNLSFLNPGLPAELALYGTIDSDACQAMHNTAEVQSDSPDFNLANNVFDLTTLLECATATPTSTATQAPPTVTATPTATPTSVPPTHTPTPTATPTRTTEPAADLSITKVMVVPAQQPVPPGGQIQYNLDVWQAGPSLARNVVVTDVLPAEVAFGAASSGCVLVASRPPNDVLRCDLGDLPTWPPGTGIWLEVTVDSDFCGTIRNEAEVWGDTPDPDPANNFTYLDTEIGPCDAELGDLGDAPASQNHAGAGMTAYPGVQAHFPTVFDPGQGWFGPMHWRPREGAWLGGWVTREENADGGADEDGINNIDPPANTADRDHDDDGLLFPLQLDHCQPVTFDFEVTYPPGGAQTDMVLNAWFDWNRNGRWGEVLDCGQALANEWAVQDQPVPYQAAPGTYRYTSQVFVPWNPEPGAGLWLRLTLSEQPVEGREDGSGPSAGYQFGETEDYYLLGSEPPTPTATATPTQWPTPTPTPTATPVGVGPTPLYLPLILKSILPTPIFFDDFDHGTLSGWTSHLGTWTNPGSNMRGEYALGNAWNMRAETGNDVLYEGTVTLLSGNAVGLVFRSSADGASSYDAILDAVDGAFKLSKRSPYQVLASFPLTVQYNHPYRIKVVADGNTIEGYLDGVRRLTATDNTYSSGHLGVVLFQATAAYDDLEAWKVP